LLRTAWSRARLCGRTEVAAGAGVGAADGAGASTGVTAGVEAEGTVGVGLLTGR